MQLPLKALADCFDIVINQKDRSHLSLPSNPRIFTLSRRDFDIVFLACQEPNNQSHGQHGTFTSDWLWAS